MPRTRRPPPTGVSHLLGGRSGPATSCTPPKRPARSRWRSPSRSRCPATCTRTRGPQPRSRGNPAAPGAQAVRPPLEPAERGRFPRVVRGPRTARPVTPSASAAASTRPRSRWSREPRGSSSPADGRRFPPTRRPFTEPPRRIAPCTCRDRVGRMSEEERPTFDGILVAEREHWLDGPPHELFKRLRAECPVHWTPKITEYPEEAGYWSVTTADDVHAVSRDWQTYSSELGGITALTDAIMPLELPQAMFIGMDPPKHDRLKALFQRGFTPKRIAEHEDEIRAITVRRARPARGPRDVRPRHRRRPAGRLARDRQLHGHPAGGRRDLGAADEHDARRRRPGPQPRGRRDRSWSATCPEIFERCRQLIAERRENPTDDLTSVLVHAEIDGEGLEEHEIVMGFFLLMAAGNDSHQGDLLQRHARADREPRPAAAAARRPVADPGRGRGVAADVPGVRPLPPHRDRATPSSTAQQITRGRQGGHVVRRRPTATRRATRTPTASTSRATPSTRPSAPAAGTSASAPRSRGSSCKILLEETLDALSRRWSSPASPSTSSRRSSTSSRRCRSASAT